MSNKSKHQTTISYGDDVKEWIDACREEYGMSKAAAFRYAVRQQLQREQE